MKNREIERKFLVNGTTYRDAAENSARIMQGYICGSHGNTARIRIYGSKGFLTIKGALGGDGLPGRFEWETEVPIEDAYALLAICKGEAIDKTRYIVPNGRHKIEVDEFHGDNEGLVVAEIELDDENDPFDRPEWLGREVTGDTRYYNSALVNNPYKNWK